MSPGTVLSVVRAGTRRGFKQIGTGRSIFGGRDSANARSQSVHGQMRSKCHLPLRDRKSTRLNSSHSQISYAVFCLKKKNNTLKYLRAFSKSPLSSDPVRS